VDKGPYYEWLRREGRHEIPIPDELFPGTPMTAIGSGLEQNVAPTRGVRLVGYMRAEVGTGESGRLMAAALEASGEKYSIQIYADTRSRQNHPWNGDSTALASYYDTNLICINADQLPVFAHEAGPEFFQNRYNIGLWFWETEIFPPSMHGSFNYLHEVWVTSEFNREAIAKVSPIPVFTIPHPLDVDPPVSKDISRATLKLPDGFLFLFSFDFFSVVERKNPVGVIEAFKRAFVPGEGPKLVIKSINGDQNLAELERLHYAGEGRPDIIIRDGYMTPAERNALYAACDCYVSLHRSEGFGLTIAEAMLLEKPAIATRYSGNLEFMTDSNSFLCGYDLRRVGRGFSPYPPDARWADPKIDEAAELMRFVHRNPDEARRRGKKGRQDIHASWAPKNVALLIKSRLTALRQKSPTSLPSIPPEPEKPFITHVRTAIEQGIDVRRTVPSLLTWFLHGPRRAMKQFLRTYDEHNRGIALSALAAFKEIYSGWLHERASLSMRIRAQEDEVRMLKEELDKTRQQLPAMENEETSNQATSPTEPVSDTSSQSHKKRQPGRADPDATRG